MKNIFILVVISFITISIKAQLKNQKKETFTVYGNCTMCEKLIERAGNIKNIAIVDWDVDTKQASITYDAQKTNPNDILKKIAAVGYDSDKFLAPDAAYNKLHGCCKYDRVAKKAKEQSQVQIPLDTAGLPKRPQPVVYNNQEKGNLPSAPNNVNKADAIQGRPQPTTEATIPSYAVSNIQLQASGLTCSMCNLSIKKSLEALPFISAVEANIQDASYKLSLLDYKQVNFADIQKAVKKSGFSVASLSFDVTMNAEEITNKTANSFTLYQQLYKVVNTGYITEGTQRFKIVDKGFLTDKNYKKTKAAYNIVPAANTIHVVKI